MVRWGGGHGGGMVDAMSARAKLGAFVAGVLLAAACGGAVGTGDGGRPSRAASQGTACLPREELSASFAGFDEQTVTIDMKNAACGAGACVVNHFRGRTSCPYGQAANGTAPPGATPCTVTGSGAPVRPNDPKTQQTVPAECADRDAEKVVYCSCRCANADGKTDDGGSYCACDQGYECSQLVASLGGKDDTLSGAYCIKAHTAFDRATACLTTCDPKAGPCAVPDAGVLHGPADDASVTSFIAVLRATDGGCFPQGLATDASGRAACRIFEILPADDGCAAHPGLSVADATVAAMIRASGGADASLPVCLDTQLPEATWVNGSCAASAGAGWCYVSAPAAPNGCAQSILFSPSGNPVTGAKVLLACP